MNTCFDSYHLFNLIIILEFYSVIVKDKKSNIHKNVHFNKLILKVTFVS